KSSPPPNLMPGTTIPPMAEKLPIWPFREEQNKRRLLTEQRFKHIGLIGMAPPSFRLTGIIVHVSSVRFRLSTQARKEELSAPILASPAYAPYYLLAVLALATSTIRLRS